MGGSHIALFNDYHTDISELFLTSTPWGEQMSLSHFTKGRKYDNERTHELPKVDEAMVMMDFHTGIPGSYLHL